MAWRSSGTTNDELVANLKRYGVIHSKAVEDAFRAVDRQFFVPQHLPALMAHKDQPIREGQIHISAPHIYAYVLEAMDLVPNTSMSFLNIGSGTGYLSCIVAQILGPTSMSFGVDIHKEAIDHCLASVDRYKAANPDLELPHMEFVHGNGMNIDASVGESRVGFDRIYVGASVDRGTLNQLVGLLRPGGIFVGPVDDELVKVTRSVANDGSPAPISTTATQPTFPRTFRGQPPQPQLPEGFLQQVISNVHFASLLFNPKIPTKISSRVWEPALHKYYPESFRKSCKEILLCSHAPKIQPRLKVIKEQINTAAQLPRALWFEVLSYTHRDWFEQPLSEECFLRQRLEEERQAVAQANEARLEAEVRLRVVERERDAYRRLALRWQSRLQAVLRSRDSSGESDDANDVSPLLFAGDLDAVMRQFQDEAVSSDEEATQGDEPMEAELSEGGDDNDSNAVMEETEEGTSDSESTMAASPPESSSSAAFLRQARTVSIVSHAT